MSERRLSHADFQNRAVRDGYELLNLVPKDWDAQRALAALVVVEGFIETAAEHLEVENNGS